MVRERVLSSGGLNMRRCKIVRFYFKGSRKRTLERGVSLEYAQAHCLDPETSYVTCTKPHNKRRTKKHGPWFDGWYYE